VLELAQLFVLVLYSSNIVSNINPRSSTIYGTTAYIKVCLLDAIFDIDHQLIQCSSLLRTDSGVEPLQAWKTRENELGSLNPRRKDICALGSDEFFEQVDSE
jgi:hypothetical protein